MAGNRPVCVDQEGEMILRVFMPLTHNKYSILRNPSFPHLPIIPNGSGVEGMGAYILTCQRGPHPITNRAINVRSWAEQILESGQSRDQWSAHNTLQRKHRGEQSANGAFPHLLLNILGTEYCYSGGADHFFWALTVKKTVSYCIDPPGSIELLENAGFFIVCIVGLDNVDVAQSGSILHMIFCILIIQRITRGNNNSDRRRKELKRQFC